MQSLTRLYYTSICVTLLSIEETLNAADGNVGIKAEQLAQVAAGMKKRELSALVKLHPLVAILTKVLEAKDRAACGVQGGKQLALAILEKAIAAHSDPELSPYPYLLVRVTASTQPFTFALVMYCHCHCHSCLECWRVPTNGDSPQCREVLGTIPFALSEVTLVHVSAI